MKIFAIGDTHWNFERFRPEYFPEGQELTKKDVVLQLGDFVGVWFGDKRDDEAWTPCCKPNCRRRNCTLRLAGPSVLARRRARR